MRETGTLSRDRVVAGVVAVMLNVALFALLFRQVQWHGRPTPYTPPLQVRLDSHANPDDTTRGATA